MRFIAQELREYMAKLGVKTVDELVGRTDLLRAEAGLKEAVVPQKSIFQQILNNPYITGSRKDNQYNQEERI